ncbi:DUF6685 family protein [Isorropodon fossajaponicum symbiont]|uniref:DUF6685 family protein n=1 Tax=Isorropodon fossajaponicum symbiont TaxID=883811 RepID=UPI003CCA58CF
MTMILLEAYSWDKRIFLMNSGGSHHFASARYIANKLNKNVGISGKLEKYNINQNIVRQLLNKYDVFYL